MHEEFIEIITSVDGVGQDSQAKMLYDPLEPEVDLPRDKLGDHRLDLPTARQSEYQACGHQDGAARGAS